MKRIFVFILLCCFFLFSHCVFAEDKFGFPEGLCSIMIIADQLPLNMNDRQLRFVAKHFIGSQKLTLNLSKKIRFYSKRFNRSFVVLHYHLGIWQQNPNHKFIVDGQHWGNDWRIVTKHEDWFWHNKKGERVPSRIDGKYLMNIGNSDFRKYWKISLLNQIRAGSYQGVFLDSSSVALLQWEVSYKDPRLSKKAARTKIFNELEGVSWSKAYEDFMNDLTNFLEKYGYATIPNVCGLFTTWDNTDYYNTASGAFVEGAFDTRSIDDWKMAFQRILKMIKKDKIVILESHLQNDQDVEKRLYYLSCYLLCKGRYTYLNYFSNKILSWYPEYEIDLGCPKKKIINSLEDVSVDNGLYRRKYEKGEVWLNISHKTKKVEFKKKVYIVIPKGGGPVDTNGKFNGELEYRIIKKINLSPFQGRVILY